ncbi:MAG TPA: hypothetical protein VHR47_02360, partial [Bacillota bacterium]|nr:hypothetical protein [Bacillota bacterium]
MKKSLVYEIKRYQLISISFFAILSILLSSYLIWDLSYDAATAKLLVASRLLKQAFYKDLPLFEGDFSNADTFKRVLEPSYKEIANSYPKGMALGFYAKEPDCVVVSVPKN